MLMIECKGLKRKQTILSLFNLSCWRCCYLMVSALDSGVETQPGHVWCSWEKHFTLPMPLSTQEHPGVPPNCQRNLMKCGGFTLRYTGISSRWGSSDTPLSHHAMETGISSGLVGYWARVQTYQIFIVTAKVSEMR